MTAEEEFEEWWFNKYPHWINCITTGAIERGYAKIAWLHQQRKIEQYREVVKKIHRGSIEPWTLKMCVEFLEEQP